VCCSSVVKRIVWGTFRVERCTRLIPHALVENPELRWVYVVINFSNISWGRPLGLPRMPRWYTRVTPKLIRHSTGQAKSKGFETVTFHKTIYSSSQ